MYFNKKKPFFSLQWLAESHKVTLKPLLPSAKYSQKCCFAKKTKKQILVSHSEIFLFFKISQPGNTGQVSGAAGTWAPAWLPGHPSPTPHFQSFSNFSLASLLVSLLNHFNSTKWSLCYCPYLLSMSSGSPMLSLLSETSFYCCQHCSVAVPAEQQAAGSALPSSSSRKLPPAIWFQNICLAVFLIGAIKEMLEKKNNKNRTRYTVQKKKKSDIIYLQSFCATIIIINITTMTNN